MKARLGITLFTALALAASMTACANPDDSGANTKSKDVGKTIEVTKDKKIAAMVPEKYQKRGSFTASINPDVAPVKFTDSNGKIVGLVPDLLNSAATVMGIKLNLQKGQFDAMVPGLESKRFDVVASIGDFKERQKKIDFIDYLQTGTAILTSSDFKADKIKPNKDLCGLKVGYVRGTAQQGLISKASKACVAAGKKKVQSNGYGDSGAALLSVKSSQADAFWGDSPAMLYNAKKSPDLYKIVFQQKIGPYGIGINKDNSKFRDALRAALLKLVETGKYKQLIDKWGQEGFAMPKMPLNTGPKLES
ncbi:ABC transporter substrate-binding protein [Spelaeicoccus albus]|uniref:Polar amino acid transport system substrate-binding protein n=1 Tax=Spelaeicoccus albus TaxID=1280376 RepID=A0A7Z0ABF9_9MICO|nr:ABC transporter substrate-binding protein [Spelaeicoccus albus]NYI67111.1 polar amino acid transport system substrate-binding protein [Spelaeicoccus albus]